MNGYDDADPDEIVNVFIPPLHGRYVGSAGLHRGPDRGDPPVDLRRRHRAGHLADRRVRRRDQQPEPDVPVLDAGPQPDRVQSDRRLRWRRRRGVRQRPVELERSRLRHGDPGRVQPDGRQHDQRRGAGRDLPGRRRYAGSGQRVDDCTVVENSYALAGPASQPPGASETGAGRRDGPGRSHEGRPPTTVRGDRPKAPSETQPRPCEVGGNGSAYATCRGSSTRACTRTGSRSSTERRPT